MEHKLCDICQSNDYSKWYLCGKSQQMVKQCMHEIMQRVEDEAIQKQQLQEALRQQKVERVSRWCKNLLYSFVVILIIVGIGYGLSKIPKQEPPVINGGKIVAISAYDEYEVFSGNKSTYKKWPIWIEVNGMVYKYYLSRWELMHYFEVGSYINTTYSGNNIGTFTVYK